LELLGLCTSDFEFGLLFCWSDSTSTLLEPGLVLMISIQGGVEYARALLLEMKCLEGVEG
jgi:hypothetical protein